MIISPSNFNGNKDKWDISYLNVYSQCMHRIFRLIVFKIHAVGDFLSRLLPNPLLLMLYVQLHVELKVNYLKQPKDQKFSFLLGSVEICKFCSR